MIVYALNSLTAQKTLYGCNFQLPIRVVMQYPIWPNKIGLRANI